MTDSTTIVETAQDSVNTACTHMCKCCCECDPSPERAQRRREWAADSARAWMKADPNGFTKWYKRKRRMLKLWPVGIGIGAVVIVELLVCFLTNSIDMFRDILSNNSKAIDASAYLSPILYGMILIGGAHFVSKMSKRFFKDQEDFEIVEDTVRAEMWESNFNQEEKCHGKTQESR